MELKQSTFEEIVETERGLVLDEKRATESTAAPHERVRFSSHAR